MTAGRWRRERRAVSYAESRVGGSDRRLAGTPPRSTGTLVDVTGADLGHCQSTSWVVACSARSGMADADPAAATDAPSRSPTIATTAAILRIDIPFVPAAEAGGMSRLEQEGGSGQTLDRHWTGSSPTRSSTELRLTGVTSGALSATSFDVTSEARGVGLPRGPGRRR
jgi:hypothetical protein